MLFFMPIAAVAQAPSSHEPTLPEQTRSLVVSELPSGATPPHLAASRDCAPPRDINHQIIAPAVFEFKVTTLGTVRDIVIRQSTGDNLIDEALEDCVSGWVYTPAMADGRPIEVLWMTSMNMKIQPVGSDPGVPASAVKLPVRKHREGSMWCETWHQNSDRGALLSFYVETDGSVANVSIVESSGSAKTDKDAVSCVSQRTYQPGFKNGKPTEVKLTDWLYSRAHRVYPQLDPWLP